MAGPRGRREEGDCLDPCARRRIRRRPNRIFLAGGSSRAQLASVAALTPSDQRFQPGFEEADTSVCAAISIYGRYGWGDAGPGVPPSSPLAYIRPDAPPIFIAHGRSDTLLAASAAREFAAALLERSRAAVVYAELPGAQHQFDLHHSIRCAAVTNGIEAFASWLLGNPQMRGEGNEQCLKPVDLPGRARGRGVPSR